VQAQAIERADLLVERFTNQGMREPVVAAATSDLDDAGACGLFEQREDAVDFHGGDGRRLVRTEVPPENRCGREQFITGGRQAADATADRFAHSIGDANGNGLDAGLVALFHQDLDELDDEQRVAIRLVIDGGDDAIRQLAAEHAMRQRGDFGLVEAGEPQAVQLGIPRQVPEGLQKRRLPQYLVVTVGTEQHDAACGQLLVHELQEGQ